MDPFLFTSLMSCPRSCDTADLLYCPLIPGSSSALYRALLMSSLYKYQLAADQQQQQQQQYQHNKSPTAVKRSFSDLDIDDHQPPPLSCLPSSVHHHPCHPRPAHSPSSSEKSLEMAPSVGFCSTTIAVSNLSKCPRLDRESSSLVGASCSSRYTSFAEADTTRKSAATQTFFSSFAHSSNEVSSVQQQQQQQRLPPPPYPSDSHARLDGFRSNYGLVTDIDDSPSRLIIDVDCRVASRPLSSSSSSSSTFQATSSSTMTMTTAVDEDDDSTNVPLNLTKRSAVDCSGSVAMDTRSTGTGCRSSPSVMPSAPHQLYGQPPASATAAATFVWKSEFGNQSPSSSSPPSWLDRSAMGSGFRAVGGGIQRAAAVELRRPDSSPCLRREQRKSLSVVNVECDRNIEEHFQRSLGRDYSWVLPKSRASPLHSSSTSVSCPPPATATTSALLLDRRINNVSSPSCRSFSSMESTSVDSYDVAEMTPAERKSTNISVAGTVDDHFAKSLGGATWNRIKRTFDLTTPETNAVNVTGDGHSHDLRLVSAPSSVDDHFAKALGEEAWFKIKADTERV